MSRRWTMSDLEEITNKDLILALIAERIGDLHPYGPLTDRLKELREWVRNAVPVEQRKA